jgi:hypothetical protein
MMRLAGNPFGYSLFISTAKLGPQARALRGSRVEVATTSNDFQGGNEQRMGIRVRWSTANFDGNIILEHIMIHIYDV